MAVVKVRQTCITYFVRRRKFPHETNVKKFAYNFRFLLSSVLLRSVEHFDFTSLNEMERDVKRV